MNYLGDFATGSTVYIYFNAYNAAGASVTITGLATSDILVYKNGSTTQRSSTSGFTLLDTDGIDFDGVTGVHGFSIDMSDNTDAGFWAAGNDYTIVLNSVTIDSQTVVGGPWRISLQNRYTGANVVQWNSSNVATPDTAGYPKVTIKSGTGTGELNLSSGVNDANVTKWSGTAVAAPDTAGYPKVTHKSGTGAGELNIASGVVDSNLAQWLGVAPLALSSQRPQVLTALIGTNIVNAAALAADAVAEIQSGLATATDLATLTSYVDTEIAAIKAKTDNLPAAPAAVGDIPTTANILASGDIDGYSIEQALKLILAEAAGKLAVTAAGLLNTFRAVDDSKDRITATVDADGNRTAITLDATG